MAQCLIFSPPLREVRVWERSQCGLCTSEHMGSLREESLEEYSMYLNKVSHKSCLGENGKEGQTHSLCYPRPQTYRGQPVSSFEGIMSCWMSQMVPSVLFQAILFVCLFFLL